MFNRFKELCKESGFGIGEVVEAFMWAVVECGDVQGSLDAVRFDRYVKANEVRARILLEQLRRGVYFVPTIDGEKSTHAVLIDLLGKVKDQRLIDAIEKALKKEAWIDQ